MPKVHLLDYVAGNIRSLVNAIEKCGYQVEWIQSPEDVKNADVSDLSSRPDGTDTTNAGNIPTLHPVSCCKPSF